MKNKIKAIEELTMDLEMDAEKLRTKKTRNEMEHLINQSDATLIMDIVRNLKEALEVE